MKNLCSIISNIFNKKEPTKKIITRVDVLNKVKKYKDHGLCYALKTSLKDLGFFNLVNINPRDVSYEILPMLFPKFVVENAIPFGAKRGGMYWWDPSRTEWKKRMKFVEYLIEEYRNDTTDLVKYYNKQCAQYNTFLKAL